MYLGNEHTINETYRHGEEETMNTRSGLLLGLVALGLFCAIGTAAADNTTGTQGVQIGDDIQAYNGSIGAGSSLYGLKIALENLDDSFTFNQSERLAKEVGQADLRLAELKSALAENSTGAADRALDQYWQNLNQTERTLALFNGTGPRSPPGDQSLVHAQDMLARHQLVLENLLASHAGNPGLERAYENSHALEQKLALMTGTRFERVQDADNRTWLRAEPGSPGGGNPAQERTLPAYDEVRHDLPVNRMATGAVNQSWEPTGQAGSRTLPLETNQSWQDQHRTSIQGNGNGTGGPTGYNNTYRNSNGDTRFHTR
jgi:hypothetical protein